MIASSDSASARSCAPASTFGSPMVAARAAACSPALRPKISVSSSELAPSRLPPWTDTQATSPAA